MNSQCINICVCMHVRAEYLYGHVQYMNKSKDPNE